MPWTCLQAGFSHLRKRCVQTCPSIHCGNGRIVAIMPVRFGNRITILVLDALAGAIGLLTWMRVMRSGWSLLRSGPRLMLESTWVLIKVP